MDIGSGKGELNSNLSNFTPRIFYIYIDELPDEIKNFINSSGLLDSLSAFLKKDDSDRVYMLCNSMEGFLQGLKTDKAHIQLSISLDVGLKAKRRGSKRNKSWKREQTLWFFGYPMKRNSDLYQKILDIAFESLFKNKKFKENLLSTKGMVLTHSIGKRKITDTVLTTSEFCSRLTKLRDFETLN